MDSCNASPVSGPPSPSSSRSSAFGTPSVRSARAASTGRGDKVRRFTNGYLEVTGRVKDVIVRGGESVSALDLEEHLIKHPSIWAAAAVPLPDEYLGEKICAAVVFTGPPATLAELNDYLDKRGVAAHSRPDMLAPMTALPTTAVGKVDKKAIARQLGG
jgi:mycobactin salicyl-AMP ligase